jgi:hypothetical protein
VSRLLTWPEAAVAAGQVQQGAGEAELEAAGRRLRDAVMAREAATKSRIATRLRGRKRPKTRITLTALYQAMPELKRSKADKLLDDFKAYLADIDEHIDERAAEQVQLLVQPQIRELRQADRELQGRLTELARRVATMARGRRRTKQA